MLDFISKRKNKNKAENGGAEKAQNDGAKSASPSTAAGPPAKPAPSPAPSPVPPAAKAQADPAPAGGAAAPAPAAPAPVLNEDDEKFLELITSPDAEDDNGVDHADDVANRPPLPPRVNIPDITWDSDDASVRHLKLDKGKDKDKALVDTKASKKRNRLSIFRRKDGKDAKATKANLDPARAAVSAPEADREKDDLTRVLEDLNLSARNNMAFSLSTESAELVRKFTLVLKDLVNGVPTAVGDLQRLIEDRDGTIARNFEKLPKSMKKLVTQLPNKLSTTLAPELMLIAAEVQGLGKDEAQAQAKGGIKGAAKRLLMPKNLQELVTKPGAVVGLLRGIMNALKLRWPAFIGTNVIWSVALFLLLFVLWYCHKRGREVRLEREASEASGVSGTSRGDPGVVEAGDRIEELPDDPALPAPKSSANNLGVRSERRAARTPSPVKSNRG